ncbi:hypothetical protein L596_030836 [Steinernema carpocapsae]|nr:hypothetical protein L596_030836 [Steinernema carpocapsae]
MAMNPWAKVAEEVIGMFGTKPSTTPPSPPSTFPPILPSEFTRFLGNYNLFPRTQGLPINEFANSIPSTLQGDRPANFIDTGGQSFDRFVIHENQEGDNLLGLGSNLMGRWNERGLQWSNGNLRLVNMRGNNLLGSQVAVHDRSVDIPVQQWLDMASNLFDTYRGP